jgi:hypothetical protein
MFLMFGLIGSFPWEIDLVGTIVIAGMDGLNGIALGSSLGGARLRVQVSPAALVSGQIWSPLRRLCAAKKCAPEVDLVRRAREVAARESAPKKRLSQQGAVSGAVGPMRLWGTDGHDGQVALRRRNVLIVSCTRKPRPSLRSGRATQ